MRFSIRATAIGICLVPLGLGIAPISAGRPNAPAPEPQAQPGRPPGADAERGDAVKHAKRTACLKEAKARKLVGADRNAYVKDCVAAP